MRPVFLAACLLAQGCAHQVVIDSLPHGARVVVDGKDVGQTPVKVDDQGTLGSTTRQVDVYLEPYKPRRITLESSAQGKPLLIGAGIGVATSAALLATGTGVIIGSKPGSSGANVGSAMCLLSPVGLLAGLPMLLGTWQLDNDTYLVDFTEQERQRIEAERAASEQRAQQAAQEAAARERQEKDAADKKAAEDERRAMLARAKELEEHWVKVCGGVVGELVYGDAMVCGDRAIKAFDKPRAIAAWAQATKVAADSWEICEPANLIIANTPKPEPILRDVSPLVLDQCRERRQCIVQCQTARDACYNEPVQVRILEEHTAGCEAAHVTCEKTCLK